MAGRRQQKHAPQRLFSSSAASGAAAHDTDEFDESDVWGCSVETRQAVFLKPALAASARPSAARGKGGCAGARVAGSSLPVNIPDWSKILGNCRGGSQSSTRGWWEEDEGSDEGGAEGSMIPPHEILCRSRAASFSVHEGVGRTLKGRDLRRVRNAIWEKTGFQD